MTFGLLAGNRLPAQRCDLEPKYRVVNTDNFGGDYPNEQWASEPTTEKDAISLAQRMNGKLGDYSSRYNKVVRLPYTLQPGFEP